MKIITQKYAFKPSLMKSGENIIHHDSDRTPSTFKANKTEKIVMENKFIHISNTVSPIHETISFNVKNISMLKPLNPGVLLGF